MNFLVVALPGNGMLYNSGQRQTSICIDKFENYVIDKSAQQELISPSLRSLIKNAAIRFKPYAPQTKSAAKNVRLTHSRLTSPHANIRQKELSSISSASAQRRSPMFLRADVVSSFCPAPVRLVVGSRQLRRDALSKVRVIGQVEKQWIIGFIENSLVVCDQHAADERIRLERLTTQLSLHDIAGRPDQGLEPCILICPVVLDGLSAAEVDVVTNPAVAQNLRYWGFRWREEDLECKRRLVLTQTPAVCHVQVGREEFRESIVHATSSRGSTTTPPPFVLRTLKLAACRSAVMFGDILDKDMCQTIFKRLGSCEIPFQCAHGRPTVAVAQLRKIQQPARSGIAVGNFTAAAVTAVERLGNTTFTFDAKIN